MLFRSVSQSRYARIDPETYELEWYVKTEDYLNKIEAFNDFDGYLENAFQLSVRDKETEKKQGAGLHYIKT